ncbi:MAG: MFS transporter family glucose-6-phosphate receptor UhpC [Waddliaceae bacterium]|nr:MFS transporter family glucose-6-phosphate receptor UhpC [Waddliaceae bacterium]
MKGLLDKLKPDAPQSEIQDTEQVKKTYKHWRVRTFYSIFIGYAFFYFTRKSFTFAMPAMIAELGFSKADLGLLATILYCSYGISKFVSGIVSDITNPRYFFSFGLIATGICNILFGMSSSLWLFALFWGLNGWFQGFGWPPIAKYLTHWYSQSERGRWWAVWNTSHNIGGALIPLIAGFCAYHWGWRMAMYVPGVLCILCGVFVWNRLRDTPQSMGLPPVAKYRQDEAESVQDTDSSLSTSEILKKYIYKNPYLWLLGFAYFFVYVVRTAANDWTVLYLVESKGYTYFDAGKSITAFELGGFLGSLAAGWISDVTFSGKRGPVNVLYALATLLSVWGLWLVPANHVYLDIAIVFCIGFFVFGPQMLIGMAAAELAHKKSAGAATGFVGCFAYMGAAAAGYPLGRIIEDWEWYGFFAAVLICCVLATLCLLPMWSLQKKKDKI